MAQVSNIDFVERKLIRLTFSEPMLVRNDDFFDVGNYLFEPIDGGVEMKVIQVVPNLEGRDVATTTEAFLLMQGGSLGATYQGTFENIQSATRIIASNLVQNPGFEDEGVGGRQDAEHWNFSQQVNPAAIPGEDSWVITPWGGGQDFSLRGDYTVLSQPHPSVIQTDDWSFLLGCWGTKIVDARADLDYCQILQNVDFDTLSQIKLNFVFSNVYTTQWVLKFEIFAGATQLFIEDHSTQPYPAGQVVTGYNTVLDVSSISGNQDLIFKLGKINETSTTNPGWVFLDHIRPTSSIETALVKDENTFTVTVRETRLDHMKKNFSKMYDLRIGSNLWGLLSTLSEDYTKIGG